MPARDDAADLALIEQAAREAGEIALSYFGGDYRRWDKGNGQPVTEADIAVDRFLRQNLRAARPGYGWLSEETEDNTARLAAEAVFVVDPIDGTVAFMKGRPHFSISIAVVREGVPAVGVVYNPVTQECFAAREGHGANCNGAEIHVSGCAAIEGCRILGDRTMFMRPAWDAPPLKPWPSMQIENRNSLAYRLALVANGTFDAAVALSAKRDWDLAAADLIVREAGVCITTHLGARLRYNKAETIQPSLVAAGPALHAALLRQLKDLRLPHAQEKP